MRNMSIPFIIGFAIAVTGCATIVGEKTELVAISSSPDNAVFVIKDDTGQAIQKGATPASVTLRKSDGGYFGGIDYTVEFSKPGYESTVAVISSGANAWYLAGNLAFGGFPGWFIVDPLTGAMYDLNPEALNVVLYPLRTAAQ